MDNLVGKKHIFPDGDFLEVIQIKVRGPDPVDHLLTYIVQQGPGIPRKMVMSVPEFMGTYGHLFEEQQRKRLNIVMNLKKVFSISTAALLTALTLSGIAAWYSILGLTAIFAAAVRPIIIMGGSLELAKVVTTVWLHRYWDKASLLMKSYLVPAVLILAIITSMGIFGFLSKAHMDQGVPTGDVAAKIQILDEKISTQRENIKVQRENIEASRKALAQMDAQVSARLDRGDNEQSAERSVTIRKQQAKERAALSKDITTAQTEIEHINEQIASLNEERAPVASTLRKVEAEVGPIKYIAALIYGDNPDQNILERAVRWVIILLVFVFDPLALCLVIAAISSRKWEEEVSVVEKNQVVEEPPVAVVEEQVVPLTELVNDIAELEDHGNCPKCSSKLVIVPGIGPYCSNIECDVVDNIRLVQESIEEVEQPIIELELVPDPVKEEHIQEEKTGPKKKFIKSRNQARK